VDFLINKRAPVSVGLQLQTLIKLKIEAGELGPGDRLPTARELADKLEINVNTAAKAYRELESQHYLTTNRRGGTRVAADHPISSGFAIAASLGHAFADQIAALGLDLTEALPLVVAAEALKPLKVATLSDTPLEADRLARRTQAVLGDQVRCIAVTTENYRSQDYYLTLVDPALVPTMSARANIIPPYDPDSWLPGPDYPAGAD
jgi:DNA-binding transcriptional regulator YhcF (GntR family)